MHRRTAHIAPLMGTVTTVSVGRIIGILEFGTLESQAIMASPPGDDTPNQHDLQSALNVNHEFHSDEKTIAHNNHFMPTLGA